MTPAPHTPPDFPEKLTLVLKSLSLSRGGLASALGVDKSVAGRWVSGKVSPSSHNLARLSQFIAGHKPHFTLHDWDRPLVEFAHSMAVTTAPKRGGMQTIWPLLPPKLALQAQHGASESTKGYEGFWRTTRPSSDLPGRFLHDISLVRRNEDGFLIFDTGVEGFFYSGSSVLIHNQLYYFCADDAFGALSFGIINGVPRQRAEVIEGVMLTTLRDAGASPAASTLIMHRIGDLSDDPAADEAKFRELVANQPMVAPEGSVPEDVAQHLHQAASAPGMLRMLFTQSMSRGPSLAVSEPKA